MKSSRTLLLLGLIIFGAQLGASDKISKEEADRLASIFFEPRGELRNSEPVVTERTARTPSPSETNSFWSGLSPVRKKEVSTSSLMTVCNEADDAGAKPVVHTKLPPKFKYLLKKPKEKRENRQVVIPYVAEIEALRKKSPCKQMPTVHEESEAESQASSSFVSKSSAGENPSCNVYSLSTGLFGENKKTLKEQFEETVFTNNIIAFNNLCDKNDVRSIKLDKEVVNCAREYGFSPDLVNSLDPDYKKPSIIGFMSGFLDRSKSKSVSPYSLIESDEQELSKSLVAGMSRKPSPASVALRIVGSPLPKLSNSSLSTIHENNSHNPDHQSEDC